jgi:hypothetical protein
MRIILSLFRRFTRQPAHDDNLRTGSSDSCIKGYAVMCKTH